jgi:hypothetical protein
MVDKFDRSGLKGACKRALRIGNTHTVFDNGLLLEMLERIESLERSLGLKFVVPDRPPTYEEQRAWLDRKTKRGPCNNSLELGEDRNALYFQTLVSEAANVQICYNSENASFSIDLLIDSAKEAYRLLGEAIDEYEEEHYFCQPGRSGD